MPRNPGVFKVIRVKTLNSDSYIKIPNNTESLNSNSYISNEYKKVETDVTETDTLDTTTITFTPDQSVSIYKVYLTCRGVDGTTATVKLTLNGVDSDVINIGNNTAEYISHLFTFSSAVFCGTSQQTITITPTTGSADVKIGTGDSSGWSVSSV